MPRKRPVNNPYTSTTASDFTEQARSILNSPAVKVIFEADYEEVPVSIQRFLEDEQYLGVVGKSIYPTWKRELTNLFVPGNKVIEVVFSGATRTGKSTIASIIQLYNIYKLLCLKNPSLYYGLITSEPISIALFNITEELAFDVTFRKFKGYMELSPWFMSRVDYNRTGSWIELPKNLRILLGSRATHALGNAVIGGIMDEVDFSRTQSSAYKQIYDTYLNIRRRMEGQFMKFLKKDPPGMLCLISSVTNDVNSFLESRIKQASVYDNIRVYAYSQWEVKEEEYAQSPRFYVYVGDNKHPAKILDDLSTIDLEDERYKNKILTVPIEYRQVFEEDLERAMMDVAGVRPGYRTRSFIPIEKSMFNSEREPMFSRDTLEIGVLAGGNIEDYVREDYLFLHKQLPRYIHVDLSKNKDCTGIACVTILYNAAQESKLQYYVDFVCRIKAPVGDEIDYEKIRSFIRYLIKQGLRIQGISYDSFQSYDSLQYFKKLNLIKHVELRSVDKYTESYYLLRSLLMTRAIDLYYHPILFKELQELQEDLGQGKIDHPIGGSKDMADALAGAIGLCHKLQSAVQVKLATNSSASTALQVVPSDTILLHPTTSNVNNKRNIGL